MSMTTLAWLPVLAGLGWFWFDTLRCREIALAVCVRMCERHGVQFLDQTVALERLGLCREPRSGRLCLQRSYRFEFSTDGASRERGTLSMRGTAVVFFDLPGHYERIISPV